MKTTCIIPCYNDASYLPQLIQTLRTCPSVSQIIIVNDDSVVPILSDIMSLHPNITVIEHVENLGKSASVSSALSQAQHEHILLMDADIYELDSSSLESYLQAFHSSVQDMLILVSTEFFPLNRLSRHNILFSGLRIIRKELLVNAIHEGTPRRYQFEIAINQYMRLHKKTVYHAFLGYKAVRKEDKVGFMKGTISNLTMLHSIVLYRFPEYVIQGLIFGHRLLKIKQ